MNKKVGCTVFVFGIGLVVAMIYLSTRYFDTLLAEITSEKGISESFVLEMTNLGILMMIIMAYAAAITVALGMSVYKSPKDVGLTKIQS